MKKKIVLMLLFFLFLFYTIFARWPGMNETSRFLLTVSIVDHNTFNIDNFYNQTTDRSFYKGHYYSDKEPGLSIISTPVYFLTEILFDQLPNKENLLNFDYNNFKTRKIFNNEIVTYSNPSKLFLTSQFLLTIFTSALFTVLTSCIIFKLSMSETKNFKKSLFFVFLYSIASLAFHYSLVFLNHALSTFLVTLAFYLFYLGLKRSKEIYIYLSALISSFSLIVDATSIIFVFLLYGFLLYRKYGKLGQVITVTIIGVLPALLFNFVNFDNPFAFPRFYLDESVWKPLPGAKGIILEPVFILNSAWRLLIDPYKGIFFYYPYLIFSFFTLLTRERKNPLVIFSLLLLIFNLFLSSSWWAWWHGAVFGARAMLISFPFLFFLLIRSSVKMREIHIYILPLVFLALFTNIAGLQKNYEDNLKDIENNSMMKKEFQEKFERLEFLPNVLKDYYIAGFLKNGVHSFVLDSIKEKGYIDIRADV